MPTYEYECLKCGKVFDHFQSISSPVLKTCDCGEKGKVKRLLGTGSGILFKGSGFYSTDYRSESYKKGAAAEKKGSDKSSTDTSSSTSTKDKAKGTSSSPAPSKKSD